MPKRARRVTMTAIVVVACVLGGTADVSVAGDGDLDDSFGVDGLGIIDSYVGGSLHGNTIAVQSDDKIIVAGSESDAGEPDTSVVLVRFHADGSLDTGFGVGGVVINPVSTPDVSYSVNGIAVGDDGTIVVVGGSSFDPQVNFVIRYLPDGSLDTSFASDGVATIDLGTEQTTLSDVAVQPDGRIVVAGAGDADGGVVARFEANGSLDTTFAEDGIHREPAIGATHGFASAALGLQLDGKILVAGRGPDGAVIIRYNSDGSPDTTFADDGVATTLAIQDPTLSYLWIPRSVAIRPDGQVVVVGYLTEEVSAPLAFVLKLNPDGSLDTAFPQDGNYRNSGLLIVPPYDPGFAEYVAGMLLQPDGQIVLAGQMVGYENGVVGSRKVFVRQIDTTGIPDPTFGDQGLVLLPLADYPSPGWLDVDQVSGIVGQSNGKIVVDCSCTGDVPGAGIVLFRLGTLAGLVPELTIPSGTANGVTFSVTNYDPDYTWSVESTAGTAVIGTDGTVSVTGLSADESISVTVATSRPGYETATAETNGVSLAQLPDTGTTSAPLALLAIACVALGGAMLAASRRRCAG